jgi:hypothetical protein
LAIFMASHLASPGLLSREIAMGLASRHGPRLRAVLRTGHPGHAGPGMALPSSLGPPWCHGVLGTAPVVGTAPVLGPPRFWDRPGATAPLGPPRSFQGTARAPALGTAPVLRLPRSWQRSRILGLRWARARRNAQLGP